MSCRKRLNATNNDNENKRRALYPRLAVPGKFPSLWLCFDSFWDGLDLLYIVLFLKALFFNTFLHFPGFRYRTPGKACIGEGMDKKLNRAKGIVICGNRIIDQIRIDV